MIKNIICDVTIIEELKENNFLFNFFYFSLHFLYLILNKFNNFYYFNIL